MKILYMLSLLFYTLSSHEIGKPFVQLGQKSIQYAEYSPNGKYVVTASFGIDPNLKLWDTQNGREIRTFNLEHQILGTREDSIFALYVHNEQYFLTGHKSGRIMIWNSVSEDSIAKLSGHKASIVGLGVNPVGNNIVSADYSGVLKLWDIKKQQEIGTKNTGLSKIRSFAFARSSGIVALGNSEGIIELYDMYHGGKQVYRFNSDLNTMESIPKIVPKSDQPKRHESEAVNALFQFENPKQTKIQPVVNMTFSPDGRYLSCIDTAHTLRVYDLKAAKALYKMEGITSIAFSPDNQKMAIYKDGRKSLRLYQIVSGKELLSVLAEYDLARANYTNISFNPSGRSISGFGVMGNLDEWDIQSGAKFQLSGTGTDLKDFALDPQSSTLVTSDVEFLNTWDLSEGRMKRSLKSTCANSGRLIVSSESKGIYSDDFSGLTFCDGKTGKSIANYKSSSLRYRNQMALSANNHKAVYVGKSGIEVIDPIRGVLLRHLSEKAYQEPVAISSDGKIIAAGYTPNSDEDQVVIKVWDAQTGEVIASFKDDKTAASVVAFTDSNNQILSGSLHGELALWDIKKEKKIKTLEKTGDPISTLSLNSTLDVAVVGYWGGTVRLWDLRSGQLLHSYSFNNKSLTIQKVQFTADQTKIIVASGNGTISVLNAQNLQELATFVQFTYDKAGNRNGKVINNQWVSESNEWIVITPEGYFNTSSLKATQHLNVLLEEKRVVGLDSFYDIFYRPDLVKLKLAGIDISKYTGNITFKEAIKNPPPKVTITSVEKQTILSNIKLKSSKATIAFKVESQNNEPYGLIRIYQEGKLVKTIGEGTINRTSASVDEQLRQEEINAKSKVEQQKLLSQYEQLSKSATIPLPIENVVAVSNTKNVTNLKSVYEIELDLIGGNNTITVEAFNQTNTILSTPASVNIISTLPKRKPILYAVLFGVNEFEQSAWAPTLKYSEKDAADVEMILSSIKKQNLYTDIKTFSLFGKLGTKENLSKTIEKIKSVAKPEDEIVFYASTHGRATKDKLFLISQNNTSIDDLINFEEIFKEIQSISALGQIFIIDACESGQANDIVSNVYDSKASVLAKSSGVHLLLATTKGTFAFESHDPSIKNSVFTHSILSTLKNKKTDQNEDQLISVIELSNTMKTSEKVADGQYPIIRNIGNDVIIMKKN